MHADADKMQRIREWRCPRTFNDVQHFLGLVQYLAHYMPDISAYTTPLSGCVRKLLLKVGTKVQILNYFRSCAAARLDILISLCLHSLYKLRLKCYTLTPKS